MQEMSIFSYVVFEKDARLCWITHDRQQVMWRKFFLDANVGSLVRFLSRRHSGKHLVPSHFEVIWTRWLINAFVHLVSSKTWKCYFSATTFASMPLYITNPINYSFNFLGKRNWSNICFFMLYIFAKTCKAIAV